jgi:hypothetical protein
MRYTHGQRVRFQDRRYRGNQVFEGEVTRVHRQYGIYVIETTTSGTFTVEESDIVAVIDPHEYDILADILDDDDWELMGLPDLPSDDEIQSIMELYCDCKEPNIIKNSACGEVFDYCKKCKKERYSNG